MLKAENLENDMHIIRQKQMLTDVFFEKKKRNARNPTDMYMHSTFFAYLFPLGGCQVRVSTKLAPSNGKDLASQKRVHLTIPNYVVLILRRQQTSPACSVDI